jgi:hypothetical protein
MWDDIIGEPEGLYAHLTITDYYDALVTLSIVISRLCGMISLVNRRACTLTRQLQIIMVLL